MDKLEKLQNEFDSLDRLVVIRRGELARAESAVKACINRLIESPDEQRQEVAKEWANLDSFSDALRDELLELERRRKVAYLVPFEYRLEKALELAREKDAATREARQKLDAAINKERRLQNGGLPGLAKDEIIEVHTAPARIQAENKFIVQEAEQAKYALERARADLEAALEEASHNPGS